MSALSTIEPSLIHYVKREFSSGEIYITSRKDALFRAEELLINPNTAFKDTHLLKDIRAYPEKKPISEMSIYDLSKILNHSQAFLEYKRRSGDKKYIELDNLRIALKKWLNTEG